MRTRRQHSLFSTGLLALAVTIGISGCGDGAAGSSAGCALDPSLQCQADFIGYSCPGAVRPDQNPNFSQGVQGIVCTDEGKLETNTNEDYCCTAAETTCAYDPGAGCAAPNVGYSCMGADRPEAFDATIFCGTGLRQNGLIVYCCGPMAAQTCRTSSAVVCPLGTSGWSCSGPAIPSEADLGVDQSRADTPLVCAAAAMSSPGQSAYCCYTPTAVPAGGTCLSEPSITGCATSSFPFACTGPDSPNQDYPRVTCSDPPTRGVNREGVAAKLFCCAYNQML